MNIIIRFADAEAERTAFGKLAGRFSFKSWDNGEMTVPDEALAYVASENISFQGIGRATDARFAAIRNPAPVAVERRASSPGMNWSPAR